ncbi:GNAT family protein [Nostoc sp. UHCC 0302]|uniref:GNAT family N-acetyltransferase n=1 Tax=Nostoc sp. UHCC 0302 TaxID=3134896 RepID=UPI00311CB8CE
MSMAVNLPLQTERLIIRDIVASDLEAVHSYACESEVVRFMPWRPNSLEDTKNFIDRAIALQKDEPRHHFELAVILKSKQQLIGACGLHLSNADNREGLIGYCYNQNFWGQGYATEAARALLSLGFEQLGLHRIIATCDPANIGSARVMEKAGMRREGHFRENIWIKGKWRDTLLYAILESEQK